MTHNDDENFLKDDFEESVIEDSIDDDFLTVAPVDSFTETGNDKRKSRKSKKSLA